MTPSFNNNELKSNKCGCQRSRKPFAHEGMKCHSDDEVVAALPDDWIPRRTGPILANYLKQREQGHKDILQEIIQCVTAVNEQFDLKMHTLAETLLAEINQNELDIDCVVEVFYIKDGMLNRESLQNAQKNIKNLYNKRVADISIFKQEASILERERADKLKLLLREKFQCLVAVAHKTPKDLLHDFDERIYEINQQLLSNSRAFIELEACLRVQLDESVGSAKSSLNQLNLGISVVYREREVRSAIRITKEQKIAQRRSVSSSRIHETTKCPTIGSILGNVEELDIYINRLVQAYRTALLKVYTGFCGKLNILKQNLCSNQCGIQPNAINLLEFNNLPSLTESPLYRLSNYFKNTSSSKTLLETAGFDVTSMQKSLMSLEACLQNTYSILHDTGHLWDAHILRTALSQKLTIAAVEDILTSHDKIELANEVSISIAMDQLRCTSEGDKLEQQYEVIKMMLARTGEMYLQHSEVELGRLEEYMNLPNTMAKILLSEFDLFLEKYPRSVVERTGSSTASPRPPKRSPSSLRLPIPRAVLQTELQGTALKNWRDGYLESFASNVSLVPELLRHHAQLWVDERSSSLHMRFSMKMISHSIRVERINTAREIRLAELGQHESRLQSHLAAVYNLVDLLPVQASEYLTVDATCLYPLVTWIDRLTISINEVLSDEAHNPEFRKLKVLSYARRLSVHRSHFEESLDKAFTDYKVQLEHRFQEARISNIRFLSNIKLFNEGGRYAVQEALKTCTALTKASEVLETSSVKVFELLNNRRSQLLAYADTLLLPLMRIVDDTNKVAAKANIRQQDRKKPQGKKK